MLRRRNQVATRKAGRAEEGGLDLTALARRFDGPGVNAIVLMGSYARCEQGPYSDVDLVRLVGEQPIGLTGSGSYLVGGRLVVVSDLTPAQVEEWFTRPEVAVNAIAGVRTGRALIDREGVFAGAQIRARAFLWDATMQERANLWASQQMVGWIEEVHKGLAGLQSGDIGQQLHARFGCSWGLTRVMQVQRGVIISGENAFYDEVAAAVGPTSQWVRLRQMAFGVDEPGRRPPSLRAQVIAGLQLYVETAGLLKGVLRPGDEPLIAQAVSEINAVLGASTSRRLPEEPDLEVPGMQGEAQP